ncbi:MAG: SGNH/GDSL hydrolase family protein [Bacteroidales bacterium]|nr:SGNH/GDSL hydrolase family protein [Bacteroidales bacterium]
MMNIKRLILVAALTAILGGVCNAQDQIFKNGDEVCFIGNSITYNGGFYHNIALFYATRYPKEKINIYNCGIGGNVAANVISRMDKDILVHHPKWSVVMLGMNDVNRELYSKENKGKPGIEEKKKQALDTYYRNYDIIIQTLLKNQSRIILQTPTIYDQTAALPSQVFMGRNDALKICAGYIKSAGEKYGLKVVDYWTILNDITTRLQASDSTATVISGDRVHPGPVGHFVMGYEFLKTMKVQPYVSQVEIDANKTDPKSIVALNCIITNPRISPQALSFSSLEHALPFPVMKNAEQALSLVPFTEELNKEVLKVKSLKSGIYQLMIDGIVIGTYSNMDFEKGINLSQKANTPQNIQTLKVLKLFQNYWNLEATVRWVRGLEIGRFNSEKYKSLKDIEDYFNAQIALIKDTTSVAYKDMIKNRDNFLDGKSKEKDMLAKMQDLHDQIYLINQPVVHQFEILKKE